MISVKSISSCIGVSAGASLSVLGHFFGFARRRVPPDPTGAATQVSVRDQIAAVQGPHVHLNVIRVGFDALVGGAAAQDAALRTIDYTLYRMRIIYRQVRLGVGRVQHWTISQAEADGADDLGSESEAYQLIEDWSVFNDGIDAFVVRNISDDFWGVASDIPGECNKKSKDDGVIAGEISRTGDAFARTFAHEIGHHLGLEHNHGAKPDCPGTTNGCNNLMAQTRCATACGDGVRTAVLLTDTQGSTMRSHCSVRSGC